VVQLFKDSKVNQNEIKKWYGGYVLNDGNAEEHYNPHSVLKYYANKPENFRVYSRGSFIMDLLVNLNLAFKIEDGNLMVDLSKEINISNPYTIDEPAKIFDFIKIIISKEQAIMLMEESKEQAIDFFSLLVPILISEGFLILCESFKTPNEETRSFLKHKIAREYDDDCLVDVAVELKRIFEKRLQKQSLVMPIKEPENVRRFKRFKSTTQNHTTSQQSGRYSIA
jgi:hypothetical protein